MLPSMLSALSRKKQLPTLANLLLRTAVSEKILVETEADYRDLKARLQTILEEIEKTGARISKTVIAKKVASLTSLPCVSTRMA